MVFEKDRTTVEVDFKHVLNFDDDLADRIKVCACATCNGCMGVSVYPCAWEYGKINVGMKTGGQIRVNL